MPDRFILNPAVRTSSRPPAAQAGRVEKPAEVEENKSPPKSEHSAKRDPSAGRFFMKFRGPQALPNRPQKNDGLPHRELAESVPATAGFMVNHLDSIIWALFVHLEHAP